MSHVDDECADFHWEWMKRLWRIAVWKMKNDYEVTFSFDDIPDNITNSWHHKFWYFDTAHWTTKTDNRSLPGTRYNSEVSCIFEYNNLLTTPLPLHCGFAFVRYRSYFDICTRQHL